MIAWPDLIALEIISVFAGVCLGRFLWWRDDPEPRGGGYSFVHYRDVFAPNPPTDLFAKPKREPSTITAWRAHEAAMAAEFEANRKITPETIGDMPLWWFLSDDGEIILITSASAEEPQDAEA